MFWQMLLLDSTARMKEVYSPRKSHGDFKLVHKDLNR